VLNLGHNEKASLMLLTEEALLFCEEGCGCGNEMDSDNSQPPMFSSSDCTLQLFSASFKGCLSFKCATCEKGMQHPSESHKAIFFSFCRKLFTWTL